MKKEEKNWWEENSDGEFEDLDEKKPYAGSNEIRPDVIEAVALRELRKYDAENAYEDGQDRYGDVEPGYEDQDDEEYYGEGQDNEEYGEYYGEENDDEYIEEYDGEYEGQRMGRTAGRRKKTGRREGGYRDNSENWDAPERKTIQGRERKTDNRKNEERARNIKGAKNTNASRREKEGSKRRRQESLEEQSGRKAENQRKRNRDERDAEIRKDSRKDAGEEKGDGKKRGKKKSKWKRFFVKLLVILIILASIHYYLVGVVYSKMNYKGISSVKSQALQDQGVVNILLIGNDSRENGDDGRSDAMILLSINKEKKKIYLTSLLRDMYVEIPGYDSNRLNAAYSYGGAELLMETVEKNLDIEVNRYASVNFEAFANLLDAVGGVDLELTAEEVQLVNGYLWEYNNLTNRSEGTDYMDTDKSGLVHLNGPQALAYTRNRYIGTDFGRTERQRKVLQEVFKKLPKALVTNPKALADGILPNLTTNLTQLECYRLSFLAFGILGYDIEQYSIPLSGTYSDANIRGMAVLQIDFEENIKFIKQTIYGKE